MLGLAALLAAAPAAPAAADPPTVRIIEQPQVSQPPPFSTGGRTVVVPRTSIVIDDGTRRDIRAEALKVAIEGEATIFDGDTLRIEGRVIRLHGIDAAEPAQTCRLGSIEYPCGAMAAARLTELTLGKTVRCEGRDRTREGDLLAACFVGKAELNQAMVESGWALALRRESERYAGAEDRASKAQRGLWRGGFVRPWEWRMRN